MLITIVYEYAERRSMYKNVQFFTSSKNDFKFHLNILCTSSVKHAYYTKSSNKFKHGV